MYKRWIAAGFILAFVFAPVSGQAETLTVNTVGKHPFSTVLGAILKEAFGRIGVDLIVQELPGRRALKNANEGIEDGDAGRVRGTEKRYPNLVMIPEKILDVHIVGFSKTIDRPLNASWQDLKPYNVGILRGHQHSERMVTAYKTLVKVDDSKQLLTLLDKNRADVVVTVMIEGLSAIKDANLKGVKVVDPPLETVPIFPYLHKKHGHLVGRLDTALKDMKKDGTYARIRGQILDPYFALVGK